MSMIQLSAPVCLPMSKFMLQQSRALWAVIALVAAMATLPAQIPAGAQFAELVRQHLPEGSDASNAVAYGDVDGDGDIDLVVGNFGQNRLYLNNGSGVFVDVTSTHLPAGSDVTTSIVLADFDGDGDLDLLAGNALVTSPMLGGQNRLYWNDGSGRFTENTVSRIPLVFDNTTSLQVGDVDGDGDLDIAIGNWIEPTRLYLNNGAGVFVVAPATRFPVVVAQTGALSLGDVDGDGFLDLVIGVFGGQNRLLRNQGTGSFTDVTSSQLPAVVDSTRSVALGDVNGDGALDLVVGNEFQNRIYLNNGAGIFTEVTLNWMPYDNRPVLGIALGDVDGDGDLDMVLVGWGQSRLYTNVGGIMFVDTTASSMPPLSDAGQQVVLVDLDGDGSLDFFSSNHGPNRILWNGGLGTFRDGNATSVPREQSAIVSMVLGDVDGDGDLDLLQGSFSDRNQLYLNDGNGRFAQAPAGQFPLVPFVFTSSVALGDIDGDGDLDVIYGNSEISPYRPGQGNFVYLNDGFGRFTDVSGSHLPANTDLTSAVALGDVDGDGMLDVVFGNFGQSQLCLNNGSGVFLDVTATHLPIASLVTVALVLGDVDGDGDLDLVLGTSSQNRLYLNQGNGVFVDATASNLPVLSDSTRCIVLGDIDGDGDLDMVVANRGLNRLLLNDGSGRFTDATAGRLPFAVEDSVTCVLGDMDNDGDLDLVVGSAERNRIYLNDGTGRFQDVTATRWGAGGSDTWALALGDVDGDGDLDIAFAPGGILLVHANLQQQIFAPYVLRSGQSYEVQVYSRYGAAGPLDFAFPYLATNRLAVLLPGVGILGIDPVAPLPFVQIARPAGVASVSWSVPNAPAFVGLEILTQALVVHWPLEARLTNVIAERINR